MRNYTDTTNCHINHYAKTFENEHNTPSKIDINGEKFSFKDMQTPFQRKTYKSKAKDRTLENARKWNNQKGTTALFQMNPDGTKTFIKYI